MTGDSAWDYSGVPISAGIGNTGVWAYNPTTPCANLGGPAGWTWYVHRASQRVGAPGPWTGFYSSTDPSHWEGGINSGMACVAMCDGHVQSFKYDQLESCDFFAGPGLWVYTHWDPRY